jgi:hypothetical protein
MTAQPQGSSIKLDRHLFIATSRITADGAELLALRDRATIVGSRIEI